MAVFRLPMVLNCSASRPVAMLPPPMVLFCSALAPLAVLPEPMVLDPSAPTPLAMLLWPEVLRKRASVPLAVLLRPVIVRFPSPLLREGVARAEVVKEGHASLDNVARRLGGIHHRQIGLDVVWPRGPFLSLCACRAG